MRRTPLFEFASQALDAIIWIGFVVVMTSL